MIARCNITPESFPIEYSITGLRNSAATSRMMPMDSASRRFRFRESGIDQVASGGGTSVPLAMKNELRKFGLP